MRSIGKEIFNGEKSAGNKREKRNVRGRILPVSNFIRGQVERLKERKKKRCTKEKGRRVNTIFQTYLQSVKYTVKKYTILDI